MHNPVTNPVSNVAAELIITFPKWQTVLITIYNMDIHRPSGCFALDGNRV